MSLRIKVILLAIIAVSTIASVISIYVYINNLNKTVSDLNVIVAEQKNEISTLKCNIDTLNNEIKSLGKVVDVTDNYITSINRINDENASVKQAIYEQVISNEEIKDWFSESLPDDLLFILNNDADLWVCEDGDRD